MLKQKVKQKKQVRALVLFSGGLDSRLVVKLLQEQGIETILLHFNLPFGCGCCNNLGCNFNFSQLNNTKLDIIDCTRGKMLQEYLEIVENPKYGYGKNLNPCINCRIFMLQKAKELMKKLKCDFIATGEVLGQRPMSQYKQALINIDKETKLEGKILRPLSSKFLPETQAQKKKLIDITKFPSIIGRARNIQIELAKRFNIKFPSPAGGCLLCDKNYSSKLKDIIENKKLENEKILPEEIQLLSIGRHFRKNGKIILGRNKEENENLENLGKIIKWNIIIPKTSGPSAIFKNADDKNLAEKLIEAYSSKDLTKREQFNNIKIG